MASPVVSDLTLGNYLKIVSKGAVYNNLSEDSPLWDYIKKKKKGNVEGRQQRFSLRSSYGAAAARFVKVNGGAYPKAQKSQLSEGIANYKDFALTVEVERTLIAKALSDFSKYGEPLAEELRAKTIAMSRQLSMSLYQDGSSVIGTVSSGAGADEAASMVVTLSEADTARGFVGWFESYDRVIITNADGSIQTPTVETTSDTSATFDHYVVSARDRINNTVTLEPRDSSNNALEFEGTHTLTAGWFIYRGTSAELTAGTITIPDLNPTPESGSTTEFNTLSESWCGLEALAQNDGRLVNNIVLSGALGGTRVNAQNQPIDSQDFQTLMSQIMIAVGASRYSYNAAMMAWETYDALVESRETDRRFNSIEDNKRGVKGLGYQHGKNAIMFTPDEFCQKKRINVIPNSDVLQFYGSDFEFVKPEGGSKFMLKPNSSGYDRTIQAFMEGQGCLISVHSAALGQIHNFVVS